jgi:hypothetical protein
MAGSAPTSFLVDLVIHTSSDIGSPRVAGSTSAFNAAVSSGSVSASFLGPPPGACTRLLGLLAALGFAVSGAAPSNPSDRHFRPAGASFTLTDRDAPLKCLFEGLRQRCHPGASAQRPGHNPPDTPTRHRTGLRTRRVDDALGAPGRRYLGLTASSLDICLRLLHRRGTWLAARGLLRRVMGLAAATARLTRSQHEATDVQTDESCTCGNVGDVDPARRTVATYQQQ